MRTTLLILFSLILISCDGGGGIICTDELAPGSVCITETPTPTNTATDTPAATATASLTPTQTKTPVPSATSSPTRLPTSTPTPTWVPYAVVWGDTWENYVANDSGILRAGVYARACRPFSTPPPTPPEVLAVTPLHAGDTLFLPCHLWP